MERSKTLEEYKENEALVDNEAYWKHLKNKLTVNISDLDD